VVSDPDPATFTVGADGEPPLHYQWARDGGDIAGATSSVYVLDPTQMSDDGATFQAVVSNAYGVATSRVATLTVSGDRVTDGLVVLYRFNENGGNVVNDTSGVGGPLDLTIADTSTVHWVPGALSIDASSVITSSVAATKILTACQVSNAISIEAWMEPANITQEGPARVITMSDSSGSSANFTLGQGTFGGQPPDVIDVRLKTTDSPGSLTTEAGHVTTNLLHVVYTHAGTGETYIYIDATDRAAAMRTGALSNWTTTFPLSLANEPTGDRSWVGVLHLIAVYDRDLSFQEVQQNYAAGPQ
jgi:hypothetical protein